MWQTLYWGLAGTAETAILLVFALIGKVPWQPR